MEVFGNDVSYRTYLRHLGILDSFGITTKQWKRFKCTGKLKVRRATAIALRIEALPDSPHRATLIKMIEIQMKG
jgi:hypothetical protein